MDHESKERVAFVRWMQKEHPGVSCARYGPPARDQYIVEAVNDAWKGWHARSIAQAERQDPMARALRVIHTWAGVPGALDAKRAREISAEALGMKGVD